MRGVYILSWNEGDTLWVGKSNNIEASFRQHCNCLSRNFRGRPQPEVRLAIKKYGMPTLMRQIACFEHNIDDVYHRTINRWRPKLINNLYPKIKP